MTFPRLRAKSADKWSDESHPSEFLPQHLKDVYDAAIRILDASGDDQLRALGLDIERYRDRFRRIVLLAAAVHDLGKANDHFQGMIWRTRDVVQSPQGLRHEWATILILGGLREWLVPAVGGSELDFAIVEWAVAGHHPAIDHASPPRSTPAFGALEPRIQLLTDHPDFIVALEQLRTLFNLAPAPHAPASELALMGSENLFDGLGRWETKGQRRWGELRRTPTESRLVAAAKGCLIAADVAGSALPKARPHARDRWNWITESFDDKPKPGDLDSVVEFRLGSSTPRKFQAAVAESAAPVTFVKAGCGSGKTLAAYMWAARNHPERRLYFCYPTTGTATEGFKDYLYDEALQTPRVGAALFHGRSEIDFEIILNSGGDGKGLTEDEARLESLRAWKTPVVACTVDTVLGIVQNNRRGLFAWPALAQSAFVFDEIHAFDDRLFGALLRFLSDLPHLPVLLMTASLPKAREEALSETLGKLGRPLDPIAGPPDLEQLPRYHRETASDNDPLAIIAQAIKGGGKVLWVCNTVGRVMDAARRAEVAGLQPLLYHSRFKYEHRVCRHKGVIDAFDLKKNPGAALAICSQVAEMSLDLSADLLVTDLAPVPALIQRLGRLNRRAEEHDPTKPFVVVIPESELPYESDALQAALVWLQSLPPQRISQKHLADCWEQEAGVSSCGVTSAWLDGGPVTSVTELREASPGISVLLSEDLLRLRKASDVSRVVLPMPPPPKRLNWHSWARYRGIPVAEPGTIAYDELRGAEWPK